MSWSKQCIDKINNIPITEILPGIEGKGTSFYCRCPNCGAEGKKKGKFQGLRITIDPTKKKNVGFCNSCGTSIGGSISAYMAVRNCSYQDAVKGLANQFAVELEEDKPRTQTKIAKPDATSFVTKQLEGSGLTYDDVMASVIIDGAEVKISPFTKGSMDPRTGNIDNCADEMLILYFDLEGRRKTYIPPRNRTREIPYTRVRWSNPELHKDRSEKPIKYQTPWGAPSTLYFPDKIRQMYKSRTQFKTLFIQEGEKKAEKACKHGIMSIAMQGIGNIGRKEEGLPAEVQYLVKQCGIQNIVMLMDADWNDLKSDIKDDDRVDLRPSSFAHALVKFKKFVGSLALSALHVDIWFAHINENDAADKGIDDLLTNTLKGKEQDLRADIEESMVAHDGHGHYIDIVNISTWSDTKIFNIWNLGSSQDFFQTHHDRLIKLKSFRFGSVFYKVEDGKIKVATEFGSGKEFWSVTFDEKGRKVIETDLVDILSWLHSNGFRMHKADSGKRGFVKIDSGIIQIVDEVDIQNFVVAFVRQSTKDHDVDKFFTETVDTKLSPSKLFRLSDLVTTAGQPDRNYQQFFFRNAQLCVKVEGIAVDELTGPVWEQNLIKRDFERRRIISKFEPDGRGSYDIEFTKDGLESEFVKFLINTSNFWRGSTIGPKEKQMINIHLANKISCIGFLLRDFKALNEGKAVISMDAAMSESSQANGRTGKSFIGAAIKQFITQAFISGKNISPSDQFLFNDVSRLTKNIFIDDIKEHFDFRAFFPAVTGDLNVNVKQGARFIIPFDAAPKFYITTNHAIDNLDDSTRARIVFMAFSNWYSVDYTPAMEFGHMLFQDWDSRQWSLFDNFMCECVMIYMRVKENGWVGDITGTINPPMEDLDRRALRQEMEELFLDWAEIYFADSNLNMRIDRKEMYLAYLDNYDIKSTQVSSKTFYRKLIAFCRYKGYHINAHKRNKESKEEFVVFNRRCPGTTFIGERDVSQSREYFTINTTDYILNPPENEKF